MSFERLRGNMNVKVAAMAGACAMTLVGCERVNCEDTTTHTVAPGETAWNIVDQYGELDNGQLNKQAYMYEVDQTNPHIDKMGEIQPGQTINIPTDCS